MPKRKRLVDPHGDIDTEGVPMPKYKDISEVEIIQHLIQMNEMSYHQQKVALQAHLDAAITEAAAPKPKK